MTSQKSNNPIRALCKLNDCMFYEAPYPDTTGYCYCSHPEKKYYMKGGRCPLYRMDWQKKIDNGKK